LSERTTRIKVRGGDTFTSLLLLIEAVTRRGRLIRARALFPHDRDKQVCWLLAPIDKTTIQDEWHELEGAARDALARTYIPDEDIAHEKWTIKREREDAELLSEAEQLTKPKTESVLCEKCKTEVEPKPGGERNGPTLWLPGNLL